MENAAVLPKLTYECLCQRHWSEAAIKEEQTGGWVDIEEVCHMYVVGKSG